MEKPYRERLQALRKLMKDRGWDAVVLTGGDPHHSEYPAPRWQQIPYLSGFLAEAAEMAVTADEAGLWTDSRYFIQAEAQLEGSGVTLFKKGTDGTPSLEQWMARKFEGLSPAIAFDALCLTGAETEGITRALEDARLCPVPDLMDALWEDRPALPRSEIITLDEESVGESREHKIRRIRKWMMLEGNCNYLLLSALDEIAWVLNVRGGDIAYNPLVLSYLLVGEEKAWWLVRKGPVEEGSDTFDSLAEVAADDVQVCDYDDFSGVLARCLEGTGNVGTPEDKAWTEPPRIFLDPSSLNVHTEATIRTFFGDENILRGASPVPLWKAVKNGREIEGFREAFLEDGIAMERFLFELEKRLDAGEELYEADAARMVRRHRSRIEGWRGESFETISAYGPNAALPHYCTPETGGARLERHGLYLVDSGGQYLFGTTDITRTIPLGPCSQLEKEDYTLVLRGMIGLAMARFPAGTAGCQIDVLAREPLWQAGRNFGHGTGHGLGFFLCVHEGPQSIRQNFLSQPLLPGMVTSDEPGLYRQGRWGIRHENIILCREDGQSEFGRFLAFDTLTLCHIDTAPVLPQLLTPQERDWLNAYNERVYRTLRDRLNEEEAAWLYTKTRPV